jgi:myo-inositol-1(or 4)-monophosphatase
MNKPSAGDLDKICSELLPSVKLTAEFLMEERKKFNQDSIEYKGLNNLVSYVDKEAEKLLVKACSEVLPEAGFITEEGTVAAAEQNSGLVWVIDPLDGTTNFVHGLPVFSVSVGLVWNGTPILGIVAIAPEGKIFHAREGGGAWCNGKQIFVSKENRLENSLLATGFPYYDFDKMPQYLTVLDYLMKNSHGLRRMGSSAIDLAYVACGIFDGFFEYSLSPWDVAGGICLVREAGGIVSDFEGNDNALFGRQIVAGGPIQAALLQVIRERWN